MGTPCYSSVRLLADVDEPPPVVEVEAPPNRPPSAFGFPFRQRVESLLIGLPLARPWNLTCSVVTGLARAGGPTTNRFVLFEQRII
jgi:hypothetical protein